MSRWIRLLACQCLIAATLPAVAATAIGKVDRTEGPCQGAIAGTVNDLSPGLPVFVDEAISTGPDARIAVSLDDGTMLTLGEKASLTLDDFVFDPSGEDKLHAAITGAFRFVSGKLAPGGTREASVTTPVAVIGVRGTDFWGGPIDGNFGVVLLEGAIAVTANGGTVTLGATGQGTSIAAAGAAPGPMTNWPADKLARALATVTFR